MFCLKIYLSSQFVSHDLPHFGVLKPKQNIHLTSNNFLLARHVPVAVLNLVTEVFLSYVSIYVAVGGGSGAPEAKPFRSVWPFLPYFQTGVEERKKIPVRHQSYFQCLSPHQQEPVCSRQISLFTLRVTEDSAGVASGTLISTTTPSTLENPFFLVVLVVKNPPANAGNVRDAGLIPGKTPWRKQW